MSNRNLLLAAAGAGGAETDPNFNQTVLLLHGDGTDGAQNNTFLDSSTNNFTITRNGNTTQGTFSPFSAPDGRWSNYFDGTSDNITAPNNAAFDLSTDDFTISCWIYPVATGVYQAIVRYSNGIAQNSNFSFALSINSDNTIRFDNLSGNSQETVTGGAVAINTWSFITVTRSGSSATVYVNGSGTTDTVFATSNLPSGSLLRIGSDSDGSSSFYGYISNLRIVKGSATAPGSNPTAPLTAVSGTSLLTCQSNRFVDNSSNAFAITPAGNVKVTPFSPFAPTAAYSASVNGGSGYFDGTGDYLNTPSNIALALSTGDFTIEAWVYPTTLNAYNTICGTRASTVNSTTAFTCAYDSSGSALLYTNGFIGQTATGLVPVNTWTHIAFVRSSGTLKIYINGTEKDSASFTQDMTTQTMYVGAAADAAQLVTGYLSNVRIVKGTAVYTTSFTPSTTPLTAITNTSLLLNYTNAGIYDNTGKNNLETVGNAQIDTTTKKYGTGSMEFDGTGDYLFIPNDLNNTLAAGDYTIEFWVYANNWTSMPVLLEYGRAASNLSPGLQFYISNTSGKLDIYGGSTTSTLLISAGTNLSTGTWTHISLTRSSGSTKLFFNGTQTGSTATDTTNYTQATIFIGAHFAGASSLNGFIDDLRITKGVARYTTTFTPPDKAFPDL